MPWRPVLSRQHTSMTDITVTLIDGGFDRHVLACPGGPYFLGTNSGMWGVSPARFETEVVAGSDGARLRQISRGAKTLRVPVRIGADGEQLTAGEIQNRFEQLMDRLRPEELCRLEVERPGVHREIEVRYVRGVASDEMALRHANHPTVLLGLEFTALDPVWRDVTDPTGSVGPTTFDNAYFGGVDTFPLVNDSTVPVSPRFILEGVVENVEVVNATTGLGFRMTEVMENQTDRLIIETDPRNTPGAYLNGGRMQWWFDGFSRLEDFVLAPGPNEMVMRGLTNTDKYFGASATFRIEWIKQFDQC